MAEWLAWEQDQEWALEVVEGYWLAVGQWKELKAEEECAVEVEW